MLLLLVLVNLALGDQRMLIVINTTISVHVKQLVQIDVIARHNAQCTAGTDDTVANVHVAISVATVHDAVATVAMQTNAKNAIMYVVICSSEIISMQLVSH